MGTYTSILPVFSDLPSTSTPLDAADLNPICYAINDLDTRVTALGALTVTAKKTANYTAAANEYVLFDTTSGSLTLTFPPAPANGTQVGGKQVVRGGTNVVNLQLSGSDHFDTTTGATTGTLTMLNQGGVWQYVSAFAIWVKVSDDLPLSQLDARYISSVTNTDGSVMVGGTATAPTVSAGGLYYSAGGSWAPNVYGTIVENIERDDIGSSGIAMTSTTKTWVILLGLCPGSVAFSTFKLYVTAAAASTTITAALFGSFTLAGTSWSRLGSGNVTPVVSATGLVSTSLAFSLPSPAYVALELVMTAGTNLPSFLCGPTAISSAFLNPASGCPMFGTLNATTAPASTLNPTTGFAAQTQKIWCALS